MTAKVQKMMKRLQNNGGTWEEGERALLFTGTESWGEKKKKKKINERMLGIFQKHKKRSEKFSRCWGVQADKRLSPEPWPDTVVTPRFLLSQSHTLTNALVQGGSNLA